MIPFITIMILGLVALTSLWILHVAKRNTRRVYKLANIAEGVHRDGLISLLPTVAVTNPTSDNRGSFLLVKFGADQFHLAVCTSTDIPIGVVEDETPVFDTVLAILLRVRLLGGSGGSTARVRINSTVAAGDFLIPDTLGYAKTDPKTASTTVNQIGRALQAGVAGDIIEFDPIASIQVKY